MCEEKIDQDPSHTPPPVCRDSLMPIYRELQSIEMCCEELRRNLDRLWERLTKEMKNV
jgi:hypothetical protein